MNNLSEEEINKVSIWMKKYKNTKKVQNKFAKLYNKQLPNDDILQICGIEPSDENKKTKTKKKKKNEEYFYCEEYVDTDMAEFEIDIEDNVHDVIVETFEENIAESESFISEETNINQNIGTGTLILDHEMGSNVTQINGIELDKISYKEENITYLEEEVQSSSQESNLKDIFDNPTNSSISIKEEKIRFEDTSNLVANDMSEIIKMEPELDLEPDLNEICSEDIGSSVTIPSSVQITEGTYVLDQTDLTNTNVPCRKICSQCNYTQDMVLSDFDNIPNNCAQCDSADCYISVEESSLDDKSGKPPTALKNDLIAANTVFHVSAELQKLTKEEEPQVYVEIKEESDCHGERFLEDQIVSSVDFNDPFINMEDPLMNSIVINDSEVSKNYEIKTTTRVKGSGNKKDKTELTMVWCSLCSYTCSSVSMMERHTRRHTGDKPYKCDLCSYRASTRNSVNKHLMIHSGLKPFQCHRCQYKCRFKSVLNKHLKTCGFVAWTCNLCNFETYNRDELKEHKKTHFYKRMKSCFLCNETFKQYSDYRTHFQTAHMDGEGNFVCPLCNFRTIHKVLIRHHHKTHHGVKNFVCTHCEYETVSKSSLLKHLVTHSKEKPFQCNKCSYKCALKGALKAHMKTHSDEKPFSCTMCKYTSRYTGAVRRHYNNKHARPEESTYECNLCHYTTRDKKMFNGHLIIHENSNSAFSALNNVNLSGNEDAHFSCNSCPFKTNLPNLLRRHCDRKHKRTDDNEEPMDSL